MTVNCAKCSHNHADKHYCTFSEHGEPCLCNQFTPDTVTITINREDAEASQDPDGNWVNGSTERLAASCRAALEGER